VAGVTFCVPETARLPLHPPLAVHEVALVDDQVSFDEDPAVIEVGLAAMDAVGAAAFTDTVVDALADPPPPEQVMPYDVVAAGVTFCVPATGMLPLHPPVAVHDVALVADQLSADDEPAVIEAGVAEIDAVGLAAVTDTVVDALPEPLPPEQVMP